MIEIGGIQLLPEWPLFISAVLAGLALNLVPGADMAFVAAASARHGLRHGIVAALGIGAGALVHVGAAVLGLSALMASSQQAFTILKSLGAAYLLWIAIGLLRRPGGHSNEPVSLPRPARLFRSAMLVNITNPKVALFFLAFLPQFVSPNAAIPAVEILCLGLWFNFVGTLVNAGVAFAANEASARLGHSPLLSRLARWFAATTMGCLAVKLALSDR